ncbi:MAG TPA: hypothetical protein PKL52_08825 [Tenuifilaceae bacterium]|nr:hypothetical protein [Tenuifilaceae bacterium]
MNSFEKDFSRKVKEAFDDYNADHLVEAGWQSFQKKLEGKRRTGFVFPLWAKAATIGILLAIGSLITYRLTQVVEKTPMAETTEVELEPGTLKEVIEPAEEDTLSTDKALFVQEPQGVASIRKQRAIQTHNTDISDTSETLPMATTEVHKSEHVDTLLLAHTNSHGESVQEVSNDEDHDPIAVAIVEIEGDNERPLLPLDLPDAGHELSKQPKTSLGARLSGMYAVTKTAISDYPGIAIEFYTNHRITNNLSIQPGLALAKHSYSMVDFSPKADYLTPSMDNFTGSTDLYKTNMDIVAMEIPINIVLDLVKRPYNNIFITMGTTSLVYLDQRYRRMYNNVYVNNDINNGFPEIVYQVDRTEDRFDAFSHTDFFGLANLSIGYSFLLFNMGELSIEPFVQVPLKELTSLGVYMSFGGVSANFRFNR